MVLIPRCIVKYFRKEIVTTFENRGAGIECVCGNVIYQSSFNPNEENSYHMPGPLLGLWKRTCVIFCFVN